MTDTEKDDRIRLLNFKIKSVYIRLSWYVVYIVFIFGFLGIFWTPWCFFGLILSVFPVCAILKQTKDNRTELKKLKENTSHE